MRRCPNCGGTGRIVQRKYLVTSLRRCGECQLLYRSPRDHAASAEEFYNSEYTQGFTTNIPDLAELERLKEFGFEGQHNDYDYYVRLLRAAGSGPKLFDYGCSWGYGSYQLNQAGFSVTSFEIARARAEFASTHLGVETVPDFEGFVNDNEATFDTFFSSHVLEHVPSPTSVVRSAFRLLRPGGLFLACVPNGSSAFRIAHPKSWRQAWGQVHPNFIDDVFLDTELQNCDRLYTCSPAEVGEIRSALSSLSGGIRLGELDRFELVAFAKKT